MENNITPETQNQNEQPLSLPQKEKNEMSCLSITCWVFQIILWTLGLLLLYVDAYEIRGRYYSYESMTIQFMLILIFECCFYVIYIIFQFFSPTFSYLLHKKTDSKLVDKLKKMFNSPPVIIFICENYHYETRTYTTYDSKGNATTRTETVRVVTRVSSKPFNFYSSRDVSGLFRLNYDKSAVKDKFYVKLELIKQYDFADSVSYSDYVKDKDDFYNSNLGFDTYTDIFVNFSVDGFTEFNLINMSDSDPCGISIFWYIFFTFAGLVQLYKVYINSRCVYKSFTIRKLISTRYSLTNEESNIKYRNVDPIISFEGENINFPINEIGYVSNEIQQNLPTYEEIEFAKQYDDKVFNFNSVKGNDTPTDDSTTNDENQYYNNTFNPDNNLERTLLEKNNN